MAPLIHLKPTASAESVIMAMPTVVKSPVIRPVNSAKVLVTAAEAEPASLAKAPALATKEVDTKTAFLNIKSPAIKNLPN